MSEGTETHGVKRKREDEAIPDEGEDMDTTSDEVDLKSAASSVTAADIEQLLKDCHHYVALPHAPPVDIPLDGEEADELKREENAAPRTAPKVTVEPLPASMPENPAKTWPFELDDFQKQSIKCLERRENLLVAAHTSAGKVGHVTSFIAFCGFHTGFSQTVVAEYAIAMALRDKSRVIYTAPIKALSNQKYRELKDQFEDVGLMTGDVTLSPNASCIVMTTEILRNMLIRGSEILREVSWVIFDEVHYMRDVERGVVWEETIILLPPAIHLVFLSATLSNAHEFADWVATLKGKPCHVVSTNRRPVPLLHYVFPLGGSGLFLAADEAGTFRRDSVVQAQQSILQEKERMQREGRNRREARSPDIVRIVQLAQARNWLPIITFSFSRRECEFYALQLANSRLVLVDEEEKAKITQIYQAAVEVLSEEDQKLPQIQALLPLLLQGIAVHHSGLLPVLKEVVEILFQEALVKVLFATETFAMGVNMPAKTCVFTAIQKYDGREYRPMSSGEYTQMSGRAGRRGKDDRGICILMMDEHANIDTIKSILVGRADPLMSRFRLSYNMILNLLRVESVLDPVAIIRHSFHQFQYQISQPSSEAELDALKADVERIQAQMSADELRMVEEWHELSTLKADLSSQLRQLWQPASRCLRFMQPGRLVMVEGFESCGWAVVLGFRKRFVPETFVVDVLMRCAGIRKEREGALLLPIPFHEAKGNGAANGSALLPQEEIVTVAVALSAISAISAIRVYLPPDIRHPASKRQVMQAVDVAVSNFPPPEGPPLVELADMGLSLAELPPAANEEERQQAALADKLTARLKHTEQRLRASPLAEPSTSPSPLVASRRTQLLEMHAKLLAAKERLKEAKASSRLSQLLHFRKELNARMRVLRRLGYINQDGVIQPKGRVAAEVESCDELVVTELIFNGLFNDLDAAQSVALLSTLMPMEKCADRTPQTDPLFKAHAKAIETARYIAKVAAECKLPVNEEEYVSTFNPSLMWVTYNWCKGKSFPEICNMTDMFEGSIIRNLRRLDELLRQLQAAAHSIGNTDLQQKFEEGSKLLKHGIIFAGSLYI